MYTLILYDDDNKCMDSYTDLHSVIADGNNVYWHDGYLEGIQVNFIVLGTNAEIEQLEDVSHLIDQDIKATLLSEGNLRDKQAQEMQTMVNTILLDPTNFEQDQKITSMQVVVNDLIFNQMTGGL
jgi:hypothetical protein